MEGAEVVDLTEDSFEECRDGGQTISDEDFAKRLQMEEYETLRASDFLVAQQLQEEFQMEHSRHPENLAVQRALHARPIPRRLNVVRLSPAASSSHGAVSGSADALRPSRVQRAIERNRAAEHYHEMGHDDAAGHDHAVGHDRAVGHDHAEGHDRAVGHDHAVGRHRASRHHRAMEAEVTQLMNAVAASDAGPLEHDSLPPNSVQFLRPARRRGVDHPDGTTGRQRVYTANGQRMRMLHPLIRVGGIPHVHPNQLDFNDGGGNNYEALLDLSERIGDANNRGLSQTEVNRLPTIKYRSSSSQATCRSGADDLIDFSCDGTDLHSEVFASDDTAPTEGRDCQICLNDFSNDDLLRTLPCCHRFHVACIDQWIKKNAICPICRNDVKDHVRRRQDDWSHVDDLMS